MDHSGAWKLLSGLVFGPATDDQRAEIEAHVSGCLVCRREIQRLETTAEASLARSWNAVQRRLRQS